MWNPYECTQAPQVLTKRLEHIKTLYGAWWGCRSSAAVEALAI